MPWKIRTIPCKLCSAARIICIVLILLVWRQMDNELIQGTGASLLNSVAISARPSLVASTLFSNLINLGWCFQKVERGQSAILSLFSCSFFYYYTLLTGLFTGHKNSFKEIFKYCILNNFFGNFINCINALSVVHYGRKAIIIIDCLVFFY